MLPHRRAVCTQQADRLGGQAAPVPQMGRAPAAPGRSGRSGWPARCGGTPRRGPGRAPRPGRRPGRPPSPGAGGCAGRPARAAVRPRHWKTTSAPQSVGSRRQRSLTARQAVPSASSTASRPRAPATASRAGVASATTTSAAPWWRANRATSSPDHPGPGDQHVAAPDPVAELDRARPGGVGGRVQQPVGADRAHVGDVDAEHRVEVGRQGHEPVDRRVGGVGGLVAVGHGHQVADGHGVAAGLADPPDLHVAGGADREAGRRPVAAEHPQLARPRRRAGRGWCP